MKKLLTLILVLSICIGVCGVMTACEESGIDYTVGICQVTNNASSDAVTKGFQDALKAEIEKMGRTVVIELRLAENPDMCSATVEALLSKGVNLIMADTAPAVLAAANMTVRTPIIGTSVADYNKIFNGKLPVNVTGISDEVSLERQTKLMIDTLDLTAGDQIGVLYCGNELASQEQYEAVKKLFEEKSIAVKAYTFSQETELQTVVNAMTEECKAVYVPADDMVAQNEEAVGTICTEKGVAVFTDYSGDISYASFSVDYYQMGVEAGKMAAKLLLSDAYIGKLNVAPMEPSVNYNEELCKKLNVKIPGK